jgi:hypothetical protein
VSYNLDKWDEVYGLINDMGNAAPPMIVGSYGAGYYRGQSNVSYDRIGRAFNAGWRVKP